MPTTTTSALPLLGECKGGGGGGTQELKTYFFTEKKIATYCQDNIRTPSLRQILQWSKKLGVTSSDAKAVADRAMYRHTLGTFTPPSYSSSKFKKKIFSKDLAQERCPIQNVGEIHCPPVLSPPLWPRETWVFLAPIEKPMAPSF